MRLTRIFITVVAICGYVVLANAATKKKITNLENNERICAESDLYIDGAEKCFKSLFYKNFSDVPYYAALHVFSGSDSDLKNRIKDALKVAQQSYNKFDQAELPSAFALIDKAEKIGISSSYYFDDIGGHQFEFYLTVKEEVQVDGETVEKTQIYRVARLADDELFDLNENETYCSKEEYEEHHSNGKIVKKIRKTCAWDDIFNFFKVSSSKKAIETIESSQDY